MSTLRDQIQDVITTEPVTLFMKGTPQLVMCGNSDRALRALLDERQPLERRAPDRHVEVVAAARPVDDVHARVGERLLEKTPDRLADHRRSC